jgi:HlyD family secretion protein
LKKKWRVLILCLLVIFIAGGIFASIKYSERGIVIVQTGKVNREDLTAIVTASGEVKPRNYINIGDNAQAAPITEILVKEGDHVKKGQVLARLAAIQPKADLAAQQASLTASEADSAASEAGLKSADDNIAVAKAQVEHDKADLEQKKNDLKRAQELFDGKLISAQDFEAKKVLYDLAVSTLNSSITRVTQAESQRAQGYGHAL